MEISQKNFIIIVSLSMLGMIGFLISIIYNQPVVSIVLLCVAFIGACVQQCVLLWLTLERFG